MPTPATRPIKATPPAARRCSAGAIPSQGRRGSALAVLELAAAKFGVPAGELIAADGAVTVRGGSRRATLRRPRRRSGSHRSIATATKTSSDPDAYRVVGRSVPRVDLPAKVFGTFAYLQNVRVAGYAARPRHPAAPPSAPRWPPSTRTRSPVCPAFGS